MAQRKHLDDFLRGKIIGRLESGRTQLEVSEELGIAQSVISRLWQRFQDDATGTTVSRQTVYRRLGDIGLYARRPVRYVPLTATHCHQGLTWSRDPALWTPQQWSCMMFSDNSRFSLQSDSRRNIIWRAPGTRYHQENTIERHSYGCTGWLVWGGIILGFRTDLHVQSVTMTHLSATSIGMSFWNNMSSCAVEQFHSDACLETVDRRAPKNMKNWQWTTEGDVRVQQATPALNGGE
ncbi:HTH_Tnp_Tc3_2 domain-containing protein [Trichonephila clavipes]|nr:HTH_Tnp_Tc3_2 domain-containing protein [Trichonephila clavipes]